jgi:hypothetical protein
VSKPLFPASSQSSYQTSCASFKDMKSPFLVFV